MDVLTIALIAVAAVWIGVVVIAVGLCASAARADREALGTRELARVPSGRFLRAVAR
ncbi:MAG: hypothetical protein ACAH82_11580 [Solirubrobacteraceae bacterium]